MTVGWIEAEGARAGRIGRLAPGPAYSRHL